MRKYQHSACLFFISAIALCVPEIVHASIFSIQNLATKQISNESMHQAANTSNDYVKVANVCFITDSNDCRDNIFSANDLEKEPDGTTPPPTSPDDEVSQTPCEEAGYHKTACPEGWTAVNFCPYDTTYFKSCECHACDGYNYTADEIPAGYIKGASCDTCGETMYKIIPANCDGYSECAHGPAENALSCLSGNTVKYSNCCIPLPSESDCVYGTEEASDGCNSTRTICSECKPLPDEEGCENKHPCSDGCSGTRMCCDIDPCVDINCGTNAFCEEGLCKCNEGYEGNPIIGCSQYEEDKCENVTCGTNEHCEDGSCVCDNGYKKIPCNANSNAYNCGKCIAVDKCENVTCGTNEHCENGSCVCDNGYKKIPCNANSNAYNCGKCIAVDKCENVTCGTNEHCENGSCVCDNGYKKIPCNANSNAYNCGKCIAVDKCENVTCGTNEHCEDGSCVCDNGYKKIPCNANSNAYNCGKCIAVDKCENVTCGTNEHCEDGTCVCDDGYELVDGKCVAIDKCKDVTCGTNEHCEDGTCVCDDGYELVDGKCVAIDKCKDVTCGTNEHCEDGTCVCDDGYELVDGKCVAIDKCKDVQCEYPQVCKDGKCICEVYIATQPCPKGQVCAEKGICGGCIKCIPDPDCATYSMNCPEGSECNATDKCGNCTSCGPVDLCANKTCGTNEHCENGICLCNEGYEMVNGQCVEIDPCRNVTCGSNEHCENGTCVCDSGYELKNGRCVEIDPCRNVTCGSNEHCENGTCVCDSGYELKNGQCVEIPTCEEKTCSGYSLSACPANTICYPCTKQASNCTTGATMYKFAACQKGYHLSNGNCVADCTETTCSSSYSLSSCPSNGICSSCTPKNANCTDGTTKYQLTSCKSGYTKSGNSCVAKTCTNKCFYSLSSCPSNGLCHSCTITNSNCTSGATRYSLYACTNGYQISFSGDSCVKPSSGPSFCYGGVGGSHCSCGGTHPVGVPAQPHYCN